MWLLVHGISQIKSNVNSFLAFQILRRAQWVNSGTYDTGDSDDGTRLDQQKYDDNRQ